MSQIYKIGDNTLTLSDIAKILSQEVKIELSENCKKKLQECRSYLDAKMKNSERPIYGVNTGFGSLCNTKISDEDLEDLQRNLVVSHACGLGEEVPQEIVKIMLLLKIQSLSYAHSAVKLLTIERLIQMFNNNILPVVFQLGSLGASGDLSPLAHLCLPLLGLGEVDILEGSEKVCFKRKKSADILKSS